MFIGGLLRALHGISGQPHLLRNVIYGQHGQVRSNGTNSVNINFLTRFKDLLFFYDADGIKMVRTFLPYIACSPSKYVGLKAHRLCLLDQRFLEIGGSDDG